MCVCMHMYEKGAEKVGPFCYMVGNVNSVHSLLELILNFAPSMSLSSDWKWKGCLHLPVPLTETQGVSKRL